MFIKFMLLKIRWYNLVYSNVWFMWELFYVVLNSCMFFENGFNIEYICKVFCLKKI